MKKFIDNLWWISLIVVVIAAFTFAIIKVPRWKTDNDVFKAEYYQCINNLPAGPDSTVYNDWDEVMEECQWLARKLSTYCSNC